MVKELVKLWSNVQRLVKGEGLSANVHLFEFSSKFEL